jgi:hypothetical protein
LREEKYAQVENLCHQELGFDIFWLGQREMVLKLNRTS